MTRIVGVDLGTTCGFSAIDTEQRKFFTKELSLGHLSREDRVTEFGKNLFRLVHSWRPDVVGYEEVRFARGHGAWVIHRQEGVLIYLMDSTAFCGVGVTELKKWATGNGAATKKDMIASIPKKVESFQLYGKKDFSENEADALLVGLWVVGNCLKNGRLIEHSRLYVP